MALNLYISFVIFYLSCSNIKRGVLKAAIIIMNLFISPSIPYLLLLEACYPPLSFPYSILCCQDWLWAFSNLYKETRVLIYTQKRKAVSL